MREYMKIVYRKKVFDPYKLYVEKRMVKVIHGSKMEDFHKSARLHNYSVISISRITDVEYLDLKEMIRKQKESRYVTT